MLIECISDDKIISGLLTKGKQYECIAFNDIGDCQIKLNDKSETQWYKTEFFKDFFSKNIWFLKYIRSRI